jgi:hypothetical protein
MKTTKNYTVTVSGMAKHITAKNCKESFYSYESAVAFFQEKCESCLGFFPEIRHNLSNEQELCEGGIGYDYRVELEF